MQRSRPSLPFAFHSFSFRKSIKAVRIRQESEHGRRGRFILGLQLTGCWIAFSGWHMKWRIAAARLGLPDWRNEWMTGLRRMAMTWGAAHWRTRLAFSRSEMSRLPCRAFSIPRMIPGQFEQLRGASPLAAVTGNAEDHVGLRLLTAAAFPLEPEHLPAAGPVRIQVPGQPGLSPEDALLAPPMPLVDLTGPAEAGGSACTLKWRFAFLSGPSKVAYFGSSSMEPARGSSS